jgi:hypothetical protein
MPWRAEDMGRKGDGKLSRTLIRMVNSKVALCVDGCSVAAFGDVALCARDFTQFAGHVVKFLLQP